MNTGNWTRCWQQHLDTYLQAPPRCGYWLYSRFPLGPKTRVLEIAGGSFRDSNFLAQQGVPVYGIDADSYVVEQVKLRLKPTFELLVGDAFSMPFEAKAFYLTFSNGFLVLFPDTEIQKLLQEQARVTERWLVFLVHNAENRKLLEQFRQLAQKDPVYRIRFFNRSEVRSLVLGSGLPIISIRLLKFGGPADKLYRISRTFLPWLPLGIVRAVVARLYTFQPWNRVERIACVANLQSV